MLATGTVAVILYRVLGLARDRYEVTSGLAQLAEISWHELQVLIGLGLRGRGLGAINSGDHEDTKAGASDLLLTDGTTLQLLRVKHGGGVQVDDRTIFDLATRRDARRASAALLATTGRVSTAGTLAAKDASITLIAGADLWALVSEHLPPRLRERIANRRRTTLRNRLGVLIGSSALAGACALALVFHLSRAGFILGSPSAAPVAHTTPAEAPNPGVAVTPAADVGEATPAPAAPTEPAPAAANAAPTVSVPLSESDLLLRRRDTAAEVRNIGVVVSARWSTASTLEVELRPNSNLQDDTLFERVCAILRDTEELRFTRVQLQLRDADPAKGPAARWRQCQ